MATDEVVTAGPPARIQLKADRLRLRSGCQDVSYVTAEIVDAQGHRCPNADTEITFTVVGAGGIGAIVGLGNGDPTSHRPFNAGRYNAFHVLCLAIVEAGRQPGTVLLEASASGLSPAHVELTVH